MMQITAPITAFSPGKVIVSGEHSVGVGQPALVSALNVGITVTLTPGHLDEHQIYYDFVRAVLAEFEKKFHLTLPPLAVTVSSQIPFGCGLGSSAAFGHALFKALIELTQLAGSAVGPVDQATMLSLVQASENVAHGEASGVDSTAVVVGGAIEFQRVDNSLRFRSLNTHFLSTLPFFLVNSGQPTETTKEMVRLVRGRYEQLPRMGEVMEELGELTRTLIFDFENDTFRPELLTTSQQLLDEMGIVSSSTRHLVAEITAAGGFGKVTGAGGVQTGSGMMLVYFPDAAHGAEWLAVHQLEYYQVNLGAA